MTKNNLLLKLSLIFIILPYNIYGEITPTYSINSVTIENLLEIITPSSLVLINIDDTIITPKSNMFRYNSPYKGLIDEIASLQQNFSDANEIIAKLILQRKIMLVESNWSEFINKLKNKGALVFGFTAPNPACKLIKNFEQWQYDQLSNLGIKFTSKLNNKEIFKFDETNKWSPSFYNGIIFTNSLNKVQTLEELIGNNNISPDNIVIFENTKKQLTNLNNFLRTIDINYYGIEYLASTELNGSPEINVIKLQKELLLKTGKWLEDDEAKQYIINNNQSLDDNNTSQANKVR